MGTTFSPAYFRARRQAPAPVDPIDFCALNLALYGRQRAWVLTEWPRACVRRAESCFDLGPSRLEWLGGSLVLTIDEASATFGGRPGPPVRGTIRLTPASAGPRGPLVLAERGDHCWWPVAPLAHLQVDLDEPRVRFSGSGYHDANLGGEPIEDGFHSWTWSRSLGARACTVLYDVHRRDGGRASFGRLFREGAPAEDIAAPRLQRLRPTRWLLSRRTRTDAGARARIVRSLEDAPFYARTLIETTLAGERTLGMHESLDLDRFRNTWVQRMLPYKILHRRDG